MISVGVVLDSFDEKRSGTLKIRPLDAKTLGSVVIAAPCINGIVNIPKPGSVVVFADIRKIKYEDSTYAQKMPTYLPMIHNFIWFGEVPKFHILNKNQQPFTHDPADVSDWERKDFTNAQPGELDYYTGVPDSEVIYAENNYPQVSVWKHPYGHKITLAHKVTPNGINHDGIFLKTAGGKKIQLDDAIPDNGGADRVEISDGSVTPIGPGRFILKCSDKSSELTTHGNQLFQTNVGGQDLVILQNSSADSRRENYGSGDIVDIAYKGNHKTHAESNVTRTAALGTITDSAFSSINISSQLGLISMASLQGVDVTTLGPVNVLATAFNVAAGTTTMTVDPVLGTITNNGLVNQVINEQGYLINVGPNTLSITPAGVFITAGICTATVTPTAITFNNGLTTATLGPASTSINVGSSFINIGPANLDIMSRGADGIPNATINGLAPMPASFAAINSNFSNLFSQPSVADGNYGDITVTSLGTVWTVNSGTITYDKIQETSAASVVLGRGSLSGPGTVQELTFDGPLYVSGTTIYVGSGTKDGTMFLSDTGVWTHIEYVKFPVKNDDSVTLNRGTPVFVTGSVGASGRTLVRAASASVASSMPAIGLLEETLLVNGEGDCMAMGVLRGINTSGYAYNNPVFVASSGGITQTRPTASNTLVQNIGRVIRVHQSTGEILVMGPGRTNDVPNLIATNYLASAGTATSSTYLRGDQTWASIPISGGGGGVSDHSALAGLSANDHPQYVLSSTNDNLSSLVNNHIASGVHWELSTLNTNYLNASGDSANGSFYLQNLSSTTISATNYLNIPSSSAIWNASALQGKALNAASPTINEILKYDGTNWVNSSETQYTLNNEFGSAWTISATSGITFTKVATNTFRIAAANTSAIWNASGLMGSPLSSTISPSTNQALIYDGSVWTTSSLPAIVTDHGSLTGLADNDHPQYVLSSTNANLSSSVSGHIASGSVHFEMSSIDHGVLSGLADNDHPQYVLSSTNANLSSSISGHIATSSIHFVMSSIDHTLIQNVGTNTHASIDAHINDIVSNPHMVTADQVGNSTAQWNASAIQDIFVKISSINDGQVLIYNQTHDWFAPGTIVGVTDGDKGDITVSTSGTSWVIDNDAVTYGKIQNVSAASRLLGRGSLSGSGDVQELTIGPGLSLSGTVLDAVSTGASTSMGRSWFLL